MLKACLGHFDVTFETEIDQTTDGTNENIGERIQTKDICSSLRTDEMEKIKKGNIACSNSSRCNRYRCDQKA